MSTVRPEALWTIVVPGDFCRIITSSNRSSKRSRGLPGVQIVKRQEAMGCPAL